MKIIKWVGAVGTLQGSVGPESTGLKFRVVDPT